jgi:hypothetical protein
MNELLGFLKQLARDYKVKCDVRYSYDRAYDRALGGHLETEKYEITYSNKGQSLRAVMTRVPGTEVRDCALSDRPLPTTGPSTQRNPSTSGVLTTA